MTEETLFHEALAKPLPERAAFLAKVCADRPTLRAAVEALLAAHEAPASLLDEPALANSAPTGEFTPDIDHAGQRATIDSAPGVAPGVVIAKRYTLLEKIGEGGMGEVWVAKQTEPVKRKVAIKLIKAGMDSKAVVHRFEQERQALALMDHPNIAKVLDGGLTEDRRPYFVMELVNGLPLTKFCDETKMTTRERLELFVPVCQAVQHAHQKGIVHRDLKPSNILITLYDGKPVPKVIDFGVAKATGGKLTDDSLSTQFGAVVGTLEYMSPEQAGFTAIDVDTRADIYSLGVILYELLTGLRPFDANRMRLAALDELIRIIREEDPSKPSTRLSTDASLPSLAASRQIEPKKLMAMLRGELDWIVMKCLEKGRDRRYETANALSRDIQRFLADEPVEARPPSARYRFSKFLRRNKGPVLATAFVMATLVLGVIGTTTGMFHAETQRERAVDAERIARGEKKKAQQSEQEIKEGLDRLHRANGLLETAQRHELQKEWSKAIAACTSAIEQRPDNSQVWAARGKLYLRIGLLDEAADDFARLFELRPPNEPSWWFFHACLRLHRNDVPGYRKVCKDMIAHFPKDPDPELVRWYANTCMLAPGGLDNLAWLSKLVEQAATSSDQDNDFARLATSFRAGQFQEAVHNNSAVGNTLIYPQDIAGHCLSALVHQSMNKSELAKQELAWAKIKLDGFAQTTAYRSTAKSTTELSLGLEPAPVNADHLADWLAGCLLYREATQAVEGKAQTHSLACQIRSRTCALITQRHEALTILEAQILALPNSSSIHFQKAHLLAAEERWGETQNAIEKAIALTPPGEIFLLRKKATELFMDYRQWERAEIQVAGLKKLMAIPGRPLPTEISWLAAKVFASQSKWDESAIHYMPPLMAHLYERGMPKLGPQPLRKGIVDRGAALVNKSKVIREIVAHPEVYGRITKNLGENVSHSALREELTVARIRLLASNHQLEEAFKECVRVLDWPTPTNQERRRLVGQEVIFAEILRWDELFDTLTKARPSEAGLWMARCGRFVSHRQWDDAARDWLKVAELIRDEEPNQLARSVLETTAIANQELLQRVADRYPQKESLWWARARHLLNEKKWAEADAALDQLMAVAKDPQSVSMLRGRTLLERGEIQKADEIYAKVIDAKSGDVATLRQIAQEYVEFKRVDEAAVLLEKAVAAAPKDITVRLTRARFLAEQKRWQAAALDYHAAIDLLPPEETIGGSSRGGIYHELIGRGQNLFTQVAGMRPKDDPQPWLIQGQEFASRRLWNFAVTAYQKVIERDPKNVRVWGELGRAYANASDWDRSATAYLKCLELEPATYAPGPGTPVRVEIARWDNVFARVIDRRGDDARLWAMRTNYLLETRRFDDADAIQSQVVKINPKSPRTWSNRGNYYLVRQQWDKAEADFLMVSELIAKGESSPGQILGIYRNVVKQPKILESLLAKRPKDAWLLDAKAQHLAETNQPLPAVEEAFAKALDLRPLEPRILLNRARVYANLGQWQLAAQDFKSAITDKEIAKDSLVWYEWAAATAAKGDEKSWHDISAKMLQQFGEPRTVLDGQRIAFTCSLLPNGPADPQEMLALALKSLQEQPNAIWNVFTVSSARYRAGEYREIVAEHDAYRKRNSVFFQGDGSGVAMLLQIEVMARLRLGQTESVPPLLDRIAKSTSPARQPATQVPHQRLPGHAWACVSAYQTEIEQLVKQKK